MARVRYAAIDYGPIALHRRERALAGIHGIWASLVASLTHTLGILFYLTNLSCQLLNSLIHLRIGHRLLFNALIARPVGAQGGLSHHMG